MDLEDQNNDVKLIEYVSEWIFSISGDDKSVFPAIRAKIPKELRRDFSSFLKKNNVGFVDKARWDYARSFVEECEKYGYTTDKARKNRFLMIFLDSVFEEYVKEFCDYNNLSNIELKAEFCKWYDSVPPEKKKAGLDVLVNKAIDIYKDNTKSDIEKYVTYKKRMMQGDCDFIDKEYENNHYISSAFIKKHSKVEFLELHCLMRGYRYSKNDFDVSEKECASCGMKYNSLLSIDCPNCGSHLNLICNIFNGKYVELPKSYLNRIANCVKSLINCNYEAYNSISGGRELEELFIKEYYPKGLILKTISPTLIENKIGELKHLSDLDPIVAVDEIANIKKRYSTLHPDIISILDCHGYQDKLNKKSSEIKKKYFEIKTTEFKEKIAILSEEKDYDKIKQLLDEYDLYDPSLQNKLRKEGLEKAMVDLHDNIVEELTSEIIDKITVLVSKKYKTYNTAYNALLSIRSIKYATDLPVDKILSKKGIDKKIDKLQNLTEQLRLKEATKELFKQTDSIYSIVELDEKYIEAVNILTNCVDKLPEDELEYFNDKKWDRFKSIKHRQYLAIMASLLKRKYVNTVVEGDLLVEIKKYINLTADNDECSELREQCLKDYNDRLAIYEERVKIEKIQSYSNKIANIRTKKITPSIYNTALELRQTIRGEDKKVIGALESNGSIKSLDDTITIFKKELDKIKIESIFNELEQIYSSNVLEKTHLINLIHELNGLDEQQIEIFNRTNEKEVHTIIDHIKQEISLADKYSSDIDNILIEKYQDISYDDLCGLKDNISVGDDIHISILKGLPSYNKFFDYFDKYKQWQYEKQATVLSEKLSCMSTVSGFIIENSSFIKFYKALEEDCKNSRQVAVVFEKYNKLAIKHIKAQFKEFEQLLEITKKKCTEEHVNILKKKFSLLIDRKSGSFNMYKKEYEAVLDQFQLLEIIELVKELKATRGLFGTKLKKNKEVFIKKYEEIISKPHHILEKLPKKYAKIMDACKSNYDSLKGV